METAIEQTRMFFFVNSLSRESLGWQHQLKMQPTNQGLRVFFYLFFNTLPSECSVEAFLSPCCVSIKQNFTPYLHRALQALHLEKKNEANTLLISMAEGVTFCLHHHYLMINIFSTSDNLGKGVLIFLPWAISWVVLKKRELSSFLVQIVQGKGTYLLFK